MCNFANQKEKKQRNPKCVAKHKMKKYKNYVVFLSVNIGFLFVLTKKAEKTQIKQENQKTKLRLEHSDEDRERDVILRQLTLCVKWQSLI